VTAGSESGVSRGSLEPEVLLYGFMRAIGRFTRSGLSSENLTEPGQDDDLDRQVLAIEWSNAVFEALNWSVTLDERIRHESDWLQMSFWLPTRRSSASPGSTSSP
jgi:hypothetical protein